MNIKHIFEDFIGRTSTLVRMCLGKPIRMPRRLWKNLVVNGTLHLGNSGKITKYNKNEY